MARAAWMRSGVRNWQGACLPLGATLGFGTVLLPSAGYGQPTAEQAPSEPAPEVAAPPHPSTTPSASSPDPAPAGPSPSETAIPETPSAGKRPASLTLPAVAPLAAAQSPTPPHASGGAQDGVSASAGPALVLPTVKVEGQGARYNATESQLPRLNKPLVDTPQTVAIVSEDVIDEQRANTVREALRNVSGITISAGEGGRQGDTFILRGFSAQNDMFRDGARDLGWYTRDTFNLEGVEVFFGPSAVLFGRGSTGGAVNLVTKAPRQGSFAEVSLTGGSAPSGRIEADVNDALSESVQVRANAVVQQGKVVGRDHVEQSRAGFAPSLRFRLGERTTMWLDYLYQRERSIPDYGQPFYNGRPVSKGYGVSRNTFYGVPGADKENVDAHVSTLRLEQGLGDRVRLSNASRVGAVDRLAIPTAPRNLAPAIDPVTLGRNRFQTQVANVSLINQTDLRFDLETGALTHAANVGLELSWEQRKQTRHNLEQPGMGTAVNVTGDLRNPNAAPDLSRVNPVFSSYQRGRMRTFGLYVSDQIAIAKVVELLGSVRLDSFGVGHRSFGADGAVVELDRDDTLLNWRGGVVVHPIEATSLYAMMGSSANPSAEAGTLAAGTVSLEPEKNLVTELGAKADLWRGRLSLGGSVFRIVKNNARVPGADPMGPPTVLDGEQRAQGINVGGAGSLLPNWKLIASGTVMKSRIEKHTNRLLIGQSLPGTPERSLSLWSTVTIAKHLTLGGGVTHQSETAVNNPSAANQILNKVPAYWRADAIAGYDGFRKVDLQLNVSNLTNTLYFDQASGAQAVPAEGRMVLVTARMSL